jgi:hypothetical protein
MGREESRGVGMEISLKAILYSDSVMLCVVCLLACVLCCVPCVSSINNVVMCVCVSKVAGSTPALLAGL